MPDFEGGLAAPTYLSVRLFRGHPFTTDQPYVLRSDTGDSLSWPNPPALAFPNGTSVQLALSANKREAYGSATKAFTDAVYNYSESGPVELWDPVTGRIWGKGRYRFESSNTSGGNGITPWSDETVIIGFSGPALALSVSPVDPAQLGAQLGEYIGDGAPNGIVTAPPGSVYKDRKGTGGTWHWYKQTGTGSTGWKALVGSGSDADTVDGKHASDFVTTATYTADDIKAKLQASGSAGLDADTLDGNDSTYFVPAARKVVAGDGLSGGGSLTGDVTISQPTITPAGALTAPSGWTISDTTIRQSGKVVMFSFTSTNAAVVAAGEVVIAQAGQALNAYLIPSRFTLPWQAAGANTLQGSVIWDKSSANFYLHTSAQLPANTPVVVSGCIVAP